MRREARKCRSEARRFESVVRRCRSEARMCKSGYEDVWEVKVKVKSSMARSLPVENLLPQNVGSIINYFQ